MSLLWKKILLPPAEREAATWRDETYRDQIENVVSHPWANNEIPCPDRRAFRSMSRASLFLSHVCMEAKETLRPFLEENPFSVGVYCAVENGPIDAPSTSEILRSPMGFAESYRKFRNPKMYLKQLPNLAPAQMGISLNLRGLMNVYTHSTAGSFHALDQAREDLAAGRVKAAVVCSAHAFDDFLVVSRTRRKDNRRLVEGAAACVATNIPPRWAEALTPDPHNYYGISDPLIHYLKECSHG